MRGGTAPRALGLRASTALVTAGLAALAAAGASAADLAGPQTLDLGGAVSSDDTTYRITSGAVTVTDGSFADNVTVVPLFEVQSGATLVLDSVDFMNNRRVPPPPGSGSGTGSILPPSGGGGGSFDVDDAAIYINGGAVTIIGGTISGNESDKPVNGIGVLIPPSPDSALTIQARPGETARITDRIAGQAQGSSTAGGAGTLTIGDPSGANSGTVVLSDVDFADIAVTHGTLAAAGDGIAGDLTFDAGSLQAWGGPRTLDNAITIDSGGMGVEGADDLTLGGAVGGAGRLEKRGAGRLTLTGDNTFTGGIRVVGGTLAVRTDANLGDGGEVALGDGTTLAFLAGGSFDVPVTLAGEPRFDVPEGRTVTFGGAIGDGASPGELEIAGGGTLVLADAGNGHSGGTVVTQASTLEVAVDGALGDPHGGLTLGDATSGGTLRFGAAFDLSGTRALTLGAGGGTLDTNGFDSTIAQGIAGSGGLTKTGRGLLVLNGVNSYEGDTSVLDGVLKVGDANHPSASLAGGASVGGSAALMGHGTIRGDVVNTAGGLLAPGGSIGTLRVGGNYTQGSGSTLSIEVSPSEASKLVVEERAELDGTLQLVFQPGVYHDARYVVVSADSVDGRFATVEGTNPSGLEQTLDYGATEVALRLGDGFSVEPTGTATVATVGTAALQGSRQSMGLLLGRLSGGPSATTSSDLQASLAGTQPTQLAFDGAPAEVDGLVAQAPAVLAGMGGWFRAYGSLASVDGDEVVPGYKAEGGGFLAGAEQPLGGGFFAGAAIGYGHTWLWQDGGSSRLDTPRLALYGGWEDEGLSFGGTLGYAHHFVESERPVASGATARSQYGADELSAAAQASYRFELDEVTLVPRAGLQYVRLYGDGYAESGAPGFEMSVEDSRSDSLRPFLGLSVSRPFETAGGLELLPTLTLDYSHELLDAAPPSRVEVGGGSFVAEGVVPSRDRLGLGGSLGARLSDALAVYGDYGAVLPTGNTFSQTFEVGLRYRF